MKSQAQSVAVRFLPSLTDVAFILPLIFQFNQLGGAPSLLGDGDTGWHLRTGEWIMAHGQIPQVDVFSYTHLGKPWFAWEWLWDICFGFLNQHFGLGAVITLSMLVICCTSALVYRLILRKSNNPILSIILTGLAAAGTSIHWLARPHLFTLLFLVLFLGILDNAFIELRDGRRGAQTRKMLWVLPVLTVLWTNLHGGFLAGLILIAAYAGGAIAGFLVEPDGEAKRALLERVKLFVACGALCTLATLVNPYGIALHEHIVKYLMDPYYYEYITEFMAFDFSHPASKYIEPLMLLGVVAAGWNLYRRRFEYFLLLAGWLHLALHARRNVPLFCVVAAPLIGDAMVCWLREMQSARMVEWLKSVARRFEESAAEIAGTDRLPRLHLASGMAIAVVAVLLYAPQPPEVFKASQDPKVFPVEAANMLVRDGDDHIFTTDLWGGYMIYRLYPKAEVFIDGRSDFYGADFELKYASVVNAKYDWDQTLDHYGAQTVLVPVGFPLATALKENTRWRVVYDNKVAIMFRRVDTRRTQQVSNCPNRGLGENCGIPTAVAASMGDRVPRGSDHSRTNIVAEIGPPRLPLLNRP
ncbi:MAG TPA: hypothetical protein VGL72_08590 [Bryobacteraceae bacterium]|jgi:hypothetical protein